MLKSFLIQRYKLQFLVSRQIFQARFGLGRRRPIAKALRIDKLHRPPSASVFSTFGRKVVLLDPSLQIRGDAGVKGVVGTFQYIKMIHAF